ncbi:lytic transglycosylase domain-containing protein [Polynucleobacter sp. JS-Safj-400b-B2]|uniref:lytic transglycosylase domain-containing protein n=1 Tax=Polynucleobacter sp. JS-Safj-400b-B2 TaxID=2576921 RepID=UPI002107DD6C|nr:lytic transglycosylase domain-containing protein [Polynucleobacter sp. JS-Safj-400b-B2]
MTKISLIIIASTLLASFNAKADCFDDAANLHNICGKVQCRYLIRPNILRAIAKVESNFNQRAVGYNQNGTRDLGLMQINSIHLPVLRKFGITENHLYDGCTSIYIGAWIYRQNIDIYGDTWNAVGAYNSRTPYYRDIYARKVYVALMAMNSVQLASN